MRNKIRFRILSVISIICLCVGTTIKSFQNDTFYVIKLGEYIYHHGVDLVDHYSWVAKLPYSYPHWLYDLFIYYIYHYFGYFGIYISTIILFILLILIVYYVHLKIHKNEFLAVFSSILGIIGIYGFASARAQLVSIILFVLEVYFIEKLNKSGKNKYIIYLTLGSLVIANVHGTAWFMYFILFLPFFGEEIVYYICKKFSNKKIPDRIILKKNMYIKKLIVSFILSFMMGIFTPSRICYTYVFRIMLGDSQKYIMEHAPLVIIHAPLFLVIILVLLLVLVFTKTRVYLKEMFMICGLLLMSLISIRHLVFFYLIGIIYISSICVRALNDNGDVTLDIIYQFITSNKLIYGFIIISVILVSYTKFNEHYDKDYVVLKSYPVKATDYIKNNLDYKNIKLYNDYNVGSYLLYQDIPVFIDSRCDLYLSEFNGIGNSIFDDAVNIEKNYEKIFSKYGVEYVLVSKNDILYRLLDKDIDYKMVYKDKYFALFQVIRDE